MSDRLGLGKQTNLFRTRLLGWLYHHDWQLAGLLAIATIAAAAFVLWPRPDPVEQTGVPAVISAVDIEADHVRKDKVQFSGEVHQHEYYTIRAWIGDPVASDDT